jgi:hypothetical protein
VRVCSLRYSARNAHCYLWPVPLYNIFPHFLINGTIFEIITIIRRRRRRRRKRRRTRRRRRKKEREKERNKEEVERAAEHKM